MGRLAAGSPDVDGTVESGQNGNSQPTPCRRARAFVRRRRQRRRRRLVLLGIALLALGIVAGAALVRFWRRSYDLFYVRSCASHFIQHRHKLEIIAQDHPDVVLPPAGTPAYERWFRGYGPACPESIRRDGSIGYVYVGDGLRLGDVLDRSILVLFCPGENHRGSNEHCHAWSRAAHTICVLSNAEMVKELKRAIARGESGEVPYSPRAMAVLRQELAKRLRPR